MAPLTNIEYMRFKLQFEHSPKLPNATLKDFDNTVQEKQAEARDFLPNALLYVQQYQAEAIIWATFCKLRLLIALAYHLF